DPGMAALGAKLFSSTLISQDGKVACSSCHLGEHGLAHAVPVSKIPHRPVTTTNSTTLYNVGLLYKLTWSGRFDTLEAHIDALIESPKIMGTSWTSIAERLAAVPGWTQQFEAVFAGGLGANNVRASLLAYERSLVTPDSAFDRWLNGDQAAISSDERAGYALFKAYGCVSCHQGVLVGGNMFQRFGVMRDYSPGADSGTPDRSRYSVTRRHEDRQVYRVPSLRNVALTAPYFHDGSAPDLETAVRVMAEYQLGRTLEDGDSRLIVAFLKSLTGTLHGKPL
ncbi:MAG TPA: cytochrome c peroxidase, partial [Polyangiaceae bacterium]|nr:cytochrome c peroxidase [Polyangiaceae bacterium]